MAAGGLPLDRQAERSLWGLTSHTLGPQMATGRGRRVGLLWVAVPCRLSSVRKLTLLSLIVLSVNRQERAAHSGRELDDVLEMWHTKAEGGV